MAISAVTPASQSVTSSGSMGMEDFLKILLTQLVYQDPLKPMDNREFMAQMAQFTALEQSQQVNEKMSLLLANHAALQSVGLIGRPVEVATANGTLTGTVAGLSLAGDSPTLTITTASGASLSGLALSQVSAIR